MLDKSTERILRRMDRIGFAGAGEALREIARLRGVVAARDAEVAALKNSIPPLIADNERLRGQLERAHQMWQDARIEIKRLQEYYEPDPSSEC